MTAPLLGATVADWYRDLLMPGRSSWLNSGRYGRSASAATRPNFPPATVRDSSLPCNAKAVAARGGQPGHPGSGPGLLPVERCASVHDHVPDPCRRCGHPLSGMDPAPYRHHVIDILLIRAEVIEHLLHRLL